MNNLAQRRRGAKKGDIMVLFKIFKIFAAWRLCARHYGVENKLINLAKSFSKKMKTVRFQNEWMINNGMSSLREWMVGWIAFGKDDLYCVIN